MDLKIDSRNVGMTPNWKTEIEERMAALQTEESNITHARVTLTKNAHHKKGSHNAEALIVLTLPPRHTITARKDAKSFEEAIRAAFSAAEIEIKKFREKPSSNHVPKTPGPYHGVISKIFSQEAYGFIIQDGGGEVYFHRNAVHGLSFEELEDGMEVSFNMEQGVKGPQATTVNPQPILF